MPNKINPLFKKCFRMFQFRFFPTEQDKSWKKWNKDKGDSTLIPIHDGLKEDSLVMDIGGFHGDFAFEIHSRYGSKIKIFEPVPNFVKHIEKRFENNPDIEIYPIGLGGRTKTETMSVSSVASSVMRTIGGDIISINMVDIVEWLDMYSIDKIALMKINIEGGEYELLERFVDSKYIHQCDEILIQFHNFFPEAKQRMRKIQSKLSISHKLVFQYTFIWEGWKLKKRLDD